MALIKFRWTPLRIASLIIGILLLLSTFFFPWLDFSGLTLNAFDMFGWFTFLLIPGVIFCFASAFLAKRKHRGMLKIGAGVFELLLWIAVLSLIMVPLAEFIPSISSLAGSGFWLFLISTVAMLAIGLVEVLVWIKKRTLILAPASVLHMAGSLFLVVTLLIPLLVPQEVGAWGAVENQTAFSSSAMTHQEILKISYDQLKGNKAIADQMDRFPDINDIMKHEGVKLSSSPGLLLWGPLGTGGPDAESSGSKGSEHYFNPGLTSIPGSDIPSTADGTGGAPSAVGKYYLDLLEEMYLPDKGKDQAVPAKGAAWSSHFLSDIHMPYHTGGMPADLLSDSGTTTLTVQQSGGVVFWKPLEIKYEDDQPVISSIPQPPFGWGGKNDFGSAMADYRQYQKVVYTRLRDWFDPWYMNGCFTKHAPGNVKSVIDYIPVLSEKNWLIQIAASGHGSWEAWAAQEFQSQKSVLKPGKYSAKWKNGAPTFVLSTHLENQAKQAEVFTITAAKETQSNRMTWLKQPVVAINSSIEKTVTLWRASMTALRPTLAVKAASSAGNRLVVTATIRNAEANDPAKNVQAKLSVTGGKLAAGFEDTKKLGSDLKAGDNNSAVLTWEVETSDPKLCKFKLEAICNYENTPDLQYAVAKSIEPIMVTIAPGEVEKGEKIKLTVQVNPPQKTEIQLLEAWGMFEEDVKGPFSTGADGKFVKEFTIAKKAITGKHEINVRAPKLNLIGYDVFRIGKLPPFEVNKCDAGTFSLGVRPFWKNSLTGKEPSYPFDRSLSSGRTWTSGTWSGNTFNAIWDEKTADRGSFSPGTTDKGSMSITFDSSFARIMSFKLTNEHHVTSPNINPVSEEITLTGTANVPPVITDREIDWAMWTTEGVSIQQNYNIVIKSKRVYMNGSFDTLEGWDCNPVGSGAILRFQFRMPGSTRN